MTLNKKHNKAYYQGCKKYTANLRGSNARRRNRNAFILDRLLDLSAMVVWQFQTCSIEIVLSTVEAAGAPIAEVSRSPEEYTDNYCSSVFGGGSLGAAPSRQEAQNLLTCWHTNRF